MNEASAKLCGIRHYCFVRGVLGRGANRNFGGDEDFRQAFRTVNRLYVQLRERIASQGQREAKKLFATRRSKAA